MQHILISTWSTTTDSGGVRHYNKGIPISRSELPDLTLQCSCCSWPLRFVVHCCSTDLACLCKAYAPDAESTWMLSGALAHRERRRPTVGTSDLEWRKTFLWLSAQGSFQISDFWIFVEANITQHLLLTDTMRPMTEVTMILAH